MKRPVNPEPSNRSIGQDEAFRRRCPTLHDHLFDQTWDDGSSRETSTLLIFRDDGGWKACLNDRSMQRTAFICGASVQELLDAIEEGLAGDELDWRTKRPVTNQKPRKSS